jgi:hypothetical protein
VKPQIAPEALPPLATLIDGKTLVVSIMAGRTIGFLESHLPDAAIVRAMPNTPAAIGRGITVAVGNARITAKARKWNVWGYIDARDGAQAIRLALETGFTGAERFIIANADTVMSRPNAELVAEVFPGVEFRGDGDGVAQAAR